MKLWHLALEYIGISAIVLTIAFVPLTKAALGSIIAIFGAFFPSSVLESKNKDENRADIRLLGVSITLSGSIRFAIVALGVIISLFYVKETVRETVETREHIADKEATSKTILLAGKLFDRAVHEETLRGKILAKPITQDNKMLITSMYIARCAGMENDNIFEKTFNEDAPLCDQLKLNVSIEEMTRICKDKLKSASC